MESSQRKVYIASLFLGNFCEHFSLAIFTQLIPFFSTLFFSPDDKLTSLLWAYMLIPAGMMARPLGALFFGKIGDFTSRTRALSLSLCGLSLSTLAIAMLPTYASLGLFAALWLLTFRFLQNFFGIAEILGGAIYLLEQVDESKHNFYSSLYSSFKVAGILLASLSVSLVYYFDSQFESWRILFMIAALITLVSYFFRSYSSPISTLSSSKKSVTLLKIIKQNKKLTLQVALLAGFTYLLSTYTYLFFNGFLPIVALVKESQMFYLNTILLTANFICLPIFGAMLNKFNPVIIFYRVSQIIAICSFPLFYFMKNASSEGVIFIRVVFMVFTLLLNGTLHALLQKIVPENIRYTVISFGYAIGTQIIGGIAAPLSFAIFKLTNETTLLASYIFVCAVLVMATIFKRCNIATNKIVFFKNHLN